MRLMVNAVVAVGEGLEHLGQNPTVSQQQRVYPIAQLMDTGSVSAYTMDTDGPLCTSLLYHDSRGFLRAIEVV